MALRNLLLVSYHYPPMGGSGVQRALKLARYLPNAGWRAHVLTAGHAHYPLIDASLSDAAVPELHVHRVRGMEPGGLAASLCRQLYVGLSAPRWVERLEQRLYWRLDRACSRQLLPEKELLWAPSAIRRARKLIGRHGIEVIVTTSPPLSAHLVGLWLRRRLGVPWVADLRDPILDNFAYDPATRLVDRSFRWIERSVVKQADHCVVTCPELALRLSERYGPSAHGRFTTITNGYDDADAQDAPVRGHGERFVLAHVGALYRQQSIEPVLQAIRRLLKRRGDVERQLELRLVGSVAAAQMTALRDKGGRFLNHVGYQDHRAAVQEMAAADALILMTPSTDGGRLCIPAKTFEYLAFGGHIIAVVHHDTALSRLLGEAGNVTLVEPHDAQGLENAIEARFDAWQAGSRNEHRCAEAVRRYRRDRLAGEYARLLETLVDGRPRLRLTSGEAVAEDAA
jgi:glycosyltransferase involved in cell wall biosynthesis